MSQPTFKQSGGWCNTPITSSTLVGLEVAFWTALSPINLEGLN